MSPGLPTDGSRKFQPVVVASGTATSGSRMPPRSFPSRSTCGTRCGSGTTLPPIDARRSLNPPRICDTPGSDGNWTSSIVTNVRSLSRGYWLGGGGVPVGGPLVPARGAAPA